MNMIDLFNRFVDQQEWTDDSQVFVLITFINQQSEEIRARFERYLANVAFEENRMIAKFLGD